MRVRSSYSLGLLLLGAPHGGFAAIPEPEKTATAAPCTASSTSGAFFDLRPDIITLPEDGAKPHKGVQVADYFARGYDYGANFTLNICGAVVKPPADVEGVDKASWKNVSAYYEHKGRVYSIGQQSSALFTRGTQLVLQYTGGSPCGQDSEKRSTTGSVHDGARYKGYGEDSDTGDEPTDSSDQTTDTRKKETSTYKPIAEKEKSAQRRKSTTIVFQCDQDPTSLAAKVSFVNSPDECAYFFKVRSRHACATAEPHKPGSVGPGSVFAIIFFIAVLVYLVGGVMYQRTVAHARGWRQLPNYSLWSGIWNFVKDMVVILTSSCVRFLPGRRGYRTVSISPNGRGRNRDDENRLIDQLDEEWDE